MIYLSGSIRREWLGVRADLGFILSPRRGETFDFTLGPWAADNDCFTLGDRFELSRYMEFLAECQPSGRHTCLFANAPDVLGDAQATLRRSMPVLDRIRGMGFKGALVAQNGMVDLPFADFDALFIGGTTEFKLSHQARDLTRRAKDAGKWVHMGRVNSALRLRTAAMWGCDSVDGNYLRFGPKVNAPKMLRWLNSLQVEPCLNFA